MNGSDGERLTVSAADLIRQFAAWRDRAHEQPVFLANHNRITHVLLSIAGYQDLRDGDAARAPLAAETELRDQILRSFAEWLNEAIVVCDQDMKVVVANRVAAAICRRSVRDLEGRPLDEALPEISGTLLEVHVRRTRMASEPSAVDIPSPFAPDGWLHMQSFPMGRRNILLFRDITEEVQRNRMADVKEAILEAMTVHGTIGYARLSIRGTIDRVDVPLARMVELPVDRMLGVSMADLVAIDDRVAFREVLEGALREGKSNSIGCKLLSNSGRSIATHLSIVRLHGAYGTEGAVVLITPA